VQKITNLLGCNLVNQANLCIELSVISALAMRFVTRVIVFRLDGNDRDASIVGKSIFTTTESVELRLPQTVLFDGKYFESSRSHALLLWRRGVNKKAKHKLQVNILLLQVTQVYCGSEAPL